MAGVNDPVLAELQRRGVQPTNENRNRMSAAMKGAGWNGVASKPTGGMKPMQLSGQMPEDMQYGAKSQQVGDEPEAVDNMQEEVAEVKGEMTGGSPEDEYLDAIAGRKTPSNMDSSSRQAATHSQVVKNSGISDMGAKDQTEQKALDDGESNMGQQGSSDNAAASWIGDALAAVVGTGVLAAGNKLLMGQKPKTSSLGQPIDGEIMSPDGDANLKQIDASPRQQVIEQTLQKQLPSPDTVYQGAPEEQKALPKPRYRVPANKPSSKGTETVSAPDKEFQKKSQSGYDKAKSEGRVGRPSKKADSGSGRKKALQTLAKRAARK